VRKEQKDRVTNKAERPKGGGKKNRNEINEETK
jgi:hypothetical protein